MTKAPIALYISCAQKDEPLCDQIERQLSYPIKNGQLSLWHRGKLVAGSNVAAVCAGKLQTAEIILLLISADLLNERYEEVTAALARQAHGAAVLPVLLRPTVMAGAPFAGLKMLPKDGPVFARGRTRQEALVEVVMGVLEVVEERLRDVGASAQAAAAAAASDGRGPAPGALRPPVNTILFLSASPTKVDRLAFGQEVMAIRDRLQRSSYGDRFRVVEERAVTPGDLIQLLLQHRPTIVHFSGHGAPGGRLVLENDQGQPAPVSPAALERLFQALRSRGIRCVLLNACYAADQAEALAQHVDCVLGISGMVPDPTAIAFSRGFYTAVAAGESLAQAAELARVEADLQALPSPDVLKLLTRPGVAAEDIRLL